MTRFKVLIILLASGLVSQRLSAQDGESTPIGSIRGENTGDYNITDSFETGYRFSTVGGDDGKYRSDLNYGNGIRLFSSSFTANSKDGQGKWFDSLQLTTHGLGNDPYESASLRIQKNNWYEYDFSWRQNDYFNPGLTVAAGDHLENLVQRWQDQDLTLTPRKWFRIRAGFSDWNEQGPALSTIQLFDDQGNEFPLFTNVRRKSYTYRLGGDVDFAGWHLSILHRWEDFRDDTPINSPIFQLGNEPQSGTTLSSFQLNQPYHGTTPGWVGNLNTSQRRFAVNAHFIYDSGNRNFIFDELALGSDVFNPTHQQETFSSGNAKRPLMTGNLTTSLMATARLTIVNNSSVQNTRIDGTSILDQFDNALLSNDVLNFQFLGIRTVSTSTDLQYLFTKRLSAFIGYEFSERLIRSIEEESVPQVADSSFALTGRQTNDMHAGRAGVNWLILKPLRLRVEGELGRNSNPFFPISERNYTNLDSRLQFRLKNWYAAAGYRQFYNNNSITITSYSSRSRNWFADFSWTGNKHVGVDLSYSKLHLDTLGGIAFFAGSPSQLTSGESYYVSNLHVGSGIVHFTLPKHADLFVGYTITRDTGGPDLLPNSGGAVDNLLSSVHAFPLSFQYPSAKLSIPLAPKLRWNASYQYYSYHEDIHLFGIDQDYRAHNGTVSLVWGF